MTKTQSVKLFVMSTAIVAATFVIAQCGGSTPAPPTTTTTTAPGATTTTTTIPQAVALSAISLSASTITGGNSVTGTVTLTGAAPSAGAVVALSSAGPVTVPASVTVPAGATNATFTVTTTAVGSTTAATISAAFGGATMTAALSVTPPVLGPTLRSLSLNPASVNGGSTSQGTATLDLPAEPGGALVGLASGTPSVATVPASITIPAGSTTGTFTVSTSTVSSPTPVAINGNFGGSNRSVTLTVNPNMPVARFVVTGASGTDTCRLINNGDNFDCSFNGSASTATNASQQIIAWDWTYQAQIAKSETSSTPTLNPNPGCVLILPVPSPKPTQFLMTVRLHVRDTLGLVSADAVNSNVRILPNGPCGF